MNYFLLTNASARDLGVLRLAIFGIWFLLILVTPLTNYSYLPAEIFRPLGIFNLISPEADSLSTQIILSYPFLFVLKTMLLIGCLLCAAGVRPFRWIAIPTMLLIFLYDGIVKGFNGYVNHAQMAVLYGVLIISVFPAADRFSFFKKRERQNGSAYYTLPVTLTAFVLLATYSFVGIHRILFGGVELFTGDALLLNLLINTSNYSMYGFKWGLIVAHSDSLLTLFKAGFVLVTTCEVLSPFILFNRRLCYAWLAVIIPFHLLSLLAMNILFWENLILLLLLLCYTWRKAPASDEPTV